MGLLLFTHLRMAPRVSIPFQAGLWLLIPQIRHGPEEEEILKPKPKPKPFSFLFRYKGTALLLPAFSAVCSWYCRECIGNPLPFLLKGRPRIPVGIKYSWEQRACFAPTANHPFMPGLKQRTSSGEGVLQA